MKGYEAIADAVITEGVDTVFGLMAADNMSLVTYLANIGLTVVRARTEHGAVCMADGYARATGEPGIAIISEGPGAGLTGTALLTARRRRSPVVMICSETPAVERHNVKRFEQEGFFDITAGFCVTVAAPSTLAADATSVFRRVRSGRGPAVLNCPLDIFDATVPDWDYRSTVVPRPRLRPDAEVLDAAVEMLRAAEKPIIVAGRGAVDSNARSFLEACAEKTEALLGTTLQAPGLFAGNPYYMGTVGPLGTQASTELLSEADCILAVGASLNVYTADFGRLFPRAKVIHIDEREEAIGDTTPVDLAVVGDAAATAEALLEALERAGSANTSNFRTEEVRERIAVAASRKPAAYSAAGDTIDPRELLDVLDVELPDERMVVTDSGHFMFFVADGISTSDPEERVWTADFAALSVGIPMGIGVAMARPDKHCIVFVGDGGFMMSLQELDTAVRHNVSMTVIIMNDEAYGAEVHYLNNMGLSPDMARFDTPDLAKIASSFRCEGVTVRNVAELKEASSRVGGPDVPLVIDARVDPTVMHRIWEGATRLSGGE